MKKTGIMRYAPAAALLLTGVLVLAACGNQSASGGSAGGNAGSSAETAAASEAETEASGAAESSAAGAEDGTAESGADSAEGTAESGADEEASTGAAADAAAGEAGAPKIAIGRQDLYESDQTADGSYLTLSEVLYDNYYLSDESARTYPELNKALNDLAKERDERMKATSEELTSEARSMLAEGAPLYTRLYTNNYLLLHRADPGILSFLAYAEQYYGGAHGDGGYYGYNYDCRTGKELALSDVVTDLPAMGELVIEKLRKEYDPEIFFDSMEDTVRGYFQGTTPEDVYHNIAFTLEPDGITFWFGPYELAPYASGTQSVRVLFAEEPALFDSRCTEDALENYVIQMANYDTLKVDLGGDGVMDEVRLEADLTQYYEYENATVRVNGHSSTAEIWSYSLKPILVHAYGKDTLLLECTSDNDYHMVYTFDLSPDGVEQHGPDNAAFGGELPSDYEQYDRGFEMIPQDPEDFEMSSRYDLLSTLGAFRRYGFGPDGLQPKTEYFSMDNEYFKLTAKTDVAASIADPEENKILEEDTVIPKGTSLTFYRTDNEHWTDLKAGDGTVYRVFMDEKEEWPPTVGGIGINDCFDGIMFAG